MQLVIDANIIIAMLIKPGKPIDILFKEELEIFAPELLLKELTHNKDVIIRKSALKTEEIEEFLEIIKERINFIPAEDFINYREEAENICPDPKDIPYFALALQIRCPIWSNERKLKEQTKIIIYATHELIKIFE